MSAPGVYEVRGTCMHAAREAFSSRPRSSWQFGDLLAAAQPLKGLWSRATIVTDRGRLRRALRWLLESGEVRRKGAGYRLTRRGALGFACGRHNRRITRDEQARRQAERLSDDALSARPHAEAERIWRRP